MHISTSESSPLEIGWVPLPPPCAGALGMTIAPGRRGASLDGRVMYQRNLGTDLLRLRDHHGVRHLLCCLEDHEMRAHGVEALPARAAALGIETARLPIRDGGTPLGLGALEVVLDRLQRAVGRERVVVHCLGGLGRAGLVTGCLLVDLGVPLGDVFGDLVRARGPRCPETPAQHDFVRWWSQRRTVA